MKKLTTITFLAAITVLTVSGCGGRNPYDTVFVEGTVTLDGVPAENVTVLFIPRGGGEYSAFGTTDARGIFTLTTAGAPMGSGAFAGEYDVTFSRFTTEADGLTMEEIRQKFVNRLPSYTYIVPQRYGDVKTSGIPPVTVEKGKKFTFPLKTAP